MDTTNTTETTETAKREYKCVACGKTFNNAAALSTHERKCKREMSTEKALTFVPQDVDESLANDIAIAQQIAEQKRKDAPNIAASPGGGEDPIAQITRQMREAGNIEDGMSEFWGDETKHSRYIAEGYIPVTDKGVHRQYGDVKLYKRPKEITEAMLKSAGNESTSRLRMHLTQGAKSLNAMEEKTLKEKLS